MPGALNSSQTIKAFGDVRDMIDESYSSRLWQEATAMVIQGKAAAQIMGDWAQGEFAVADQKAGVDYDCLPGLGVHQVLDAGGDVFLFPKQDDPEVEAAQKKMAAMLLSPEVQVAFNLKKGSLPVRGDVDLSAANDCMQKGLKILNTPGGVMTSGNYYWSEDTTQRTEDLYAQYFADPNMTRRSTFRPNTSRSSRRTNPSGLRCAPPPGGARLVAAAPAFRSCRPER